MGLLRQILDTTVFPSCKKRDSLHSIPGRTSLGSTLIFFSFPWLISPGRGPDLTRCIFLAAVSFILTGDMKKHWYSCIKQDQLLNVIDITLEGGSRGTSTGPSWKFIHQTEGRMDGVLDFGWINFLWTLLNLFSMKNL